MAIESHSPEEHIVNSTSGGDRDEESETTSKSQKGVPLHPDGGWGWVIAAGSALCHFLVVGLGRSFGLFYLVLLDMFGQSAGLTSLVVAIFNTMRQCLGPVAGYLVDRYTVRAVVIVGGVIMLIGCTISAFATSILYLYFSFGILTGIGASFIFAPSYIIVGQYFDKKKGKAMGLATLGSGLGTVALAPIIRLLLNQYSFFGAMLIMGALQLNNCVAGCLFRPNPQWNFRMKVSIKKPIYLPPAEREMDKITSPLSEQSENGLITKMPEKTDCCSGYFNILKNVTFLLYGIEIVAMSVHIQTFLTFLPGIAMEMGVDEGRAALLLSIVGVADMAGRFFWGFIFDLKSVRNRRRLLHACIGLPMGGLAIVFGLQQGYVGFVLFTVIWGLFEGGFHAQRATIVSEFVGPEHMSSTVGFVIAFQGIGNLLGPPVAGALRDVSGSYNVAYFFCGAVLIVASSVFILNYFLQSKLQRNRPTESS